MSRGDRNEAVGQLFRQAGFRHHLQYPAIQRILNEHSSDGWHRGSHGINEKTRTPMKKQRRDEKHEDVVIEIENDARSLVGNFADEVHNAED